MAYGHKFGKLEEVKQKQMSVCLWKPSFGYSIVEIEIFDLNYDLKSSDNVLNIFVQRKLKIDKRLLSKIMLR